MLLTACRTQSHTLSTSAGNHTAAHTQRDSIYLHDSIRVEYRCGNLYNSLIEEPKICHETAASEGLLYSPKPSLRNTPKHQEYAPLIRSPDTIVVEHWHTRWRDRETVRTDTIQVETTKTETVKVRYVPKFYKYCAALTALLLLFFLLRVTFYLYRRFHP